MSSRQVMESFKKTLIGSFKLAELQKLKNGAENYPFQCADYGLQKWGPFLCSISRKRYQMMPVQFGPDDLLTQPGQATGILPAF